MDNFLCWWCLRFLSSFQLCKGSTGVVYVVLLIICVVPLVICVNPSLPIFTAIVKTNKKKQELRGESENLIKNLLAAAKLRSFAKKYHQNSQIYNRARPKTISNAKF